MRSTARLLEFVAVVALLGAASGISLAAEAVKDPVKPLQASGVIASVDALGGIVTLKESARLDPATGTIAQPTSYFVDATTVVSNDKQSLILADVRTGDAVTIDYTDKDGKRTASVIAIQTSQASAGTAAAPAAQPSGTSSTTY